MLQMLYYMRTLLFLLTLTLLALGCVDDRAERLFEMRYVNLEFFMPAGHSPLNGALVSARLLASRYEDNRTANGVAVGEVVGIRPFFATITSLDNLDFGFLSHISVRVCERTAAGCTEFDEVFRLDDLYRRNLTQLRLDPGLRAVTELLQEEVIRLEVVLFPAEITPYSMDFQLDFAFEAVK